MNYRDHRSDRFADNEVQGNAAQYDKVLRSEAEHYFKENDMDQAAVLFAQTKASLEDIALRLVV